MEIEFSTNRLAAASRSLAEATRLFGMPTGRKYIQRMAILQAIDTFAQLFDHRALRFHRLKGDRSHQYALTLTGNYRLIIERLGRETIRIVGVEDYHGN